MKTPTHPRIRRHFFPLFSTALPLAAAGLLLSGCGSREDGPVAPVTTAPTEETVTFYTFEDYTALELLDEFKARTGITVHMVTYNETDVMIEELKSNPGKYDVFICEDGYVEKLAAKRMMMEVDHSKLPNLKNLNPRLLNAQFDPGNKFTIPYLWGTTLIAYRTDLLPNPKKSWSLIHDPAVKRFSFMNERMECFSSALRARGLTLEGASQEQIAAAGEDLVTLIREGKLAFGTEKDVKDHLLTGASSAAMMFSGDAARLAEENPDVPLAAFIPDEGATVWTDSFCISRDTTRAENAYRFLDFMLEAKSGAASTNYANYSSPNLASTPFIEKALIKNETINPRPDVLENCRPFQLKDIASELTVNVGWRRIGEIVEMQASTAPQDEAPVADAPLLN